MGSNVTNGFESARNCMIVMGQSGIFISICHGNREGRKKKELNNNLNESAARSPDGPDR